MQQIEFTPVVGRPDSGPCTGCGADVMINRPWQKAPPFPCPRCGAPVKPAPAIPVRGTFKPVDQPEPTTEIPPLGYEPPTSIHEILEQGPSPLGHSTISSWLSCQEYARLKAMGVRPKKRAVIVEGVPDELDALGFGSLFHVLGAIRTIYGQVWAENYLADLTGVCSADKTKALTMLRMYDAAYGAPETEAFTILGVEVSVATDIRTLDGKGPLVRTVRYDKVIRLNDDDSGGVYSLEMKTAARGGESSMVQYTPQRMVQGAVWNANKALVEKYGQMRGVIFDVVTKTQVPKCERHGPFPWTPHQHQLALNYMRLPEATVYPLMPDGRYPQQLHTCVGKYRICEMANLCWDGASGDYDWSNE